MSSSGCLFLLLSFILCLLNVSVHATPIAQGESPVDLAPATKPAFPSLQDCRDKITPPAKDKAMYFTGLGGQYKKVKAAKKYAIEHGLTHVTACYPEKFTDKGQYEENPDAFGQFLRDFSQAYAEKTEGIAYLMLDDNQNAAPDSIFYAVEFEAMKKGGHVDKILQFPFDGGKGVDDPTKAKKIYWEKPKDAVSYAKGQCSVHVTHHQIPRGDDKYYLEATIKDANGVEIGHGDKTDATRPVSFASVLPLRLVITAAKPGSSKSPDGAPLQFAYGDDKWSSDDGRSATGDVRKMVDDVVD
ncbi:MAG: hypothetical protein L6R42_004884, partial [Xanthoria sp. 1 TBL-2021]